ncbi:hypothetical protein MICRO8M_110066 [Microbacterium sp. 8M]|nr:hypothetical protein MICRO8M_110066 [Microbacterium sp. 8M]
MAHADAGRVPGVGGDPAGPGRQRHGRLARGSHGARGRRAARRAGGSVRILIGRAGWDPCATRSPPRCSRRPPPRYRIR